MPKGLILILHSGFAKVNIEDCIAALPDKWKKLDREKIEVAYAETPELANLYELNFGQYALEHRRQFEKEILLILKEKSEYTIVYFGLAPIPLAVDLGQLFNNFRDIEVFQLHHKTKQWYQREQQPVTFENQIIVTGLPEKDQKGITSALIRVSASHFVNPEDTQTIIPNAAEVDVRFASPDEDAFHSPELLKAFTEQVKDALDSLSNNRSGLQEIHLFASVPCGLAFLIGTKISPNIHPYIQTYQYSRTQKLRYKKALTVKGPVGAGRLLIGKDRKSVV